jgi:FtsZ-interacting cell division protein ZipA
MSELRWVLLVLGVAVVAVVLGYNWWQERAWRQRTSRTLAGPSVDALLDGSRAADDDASDDRARGGSTGTGVMPAMAARAAPLAVDTADALIDAEAILERGDGFDAGRTQQVLTAAGALSRGGHVAAWDPGIGGWRSVDAVEAAGARRLRITMPLADRKGAADRSALEGFAAVAAGAAEAVGAALEMPSVEEMEARARALDALCNEVDIAIGISVVAPEGAGFAGDRVAAIAEAHGLALAPDGQFRCVAADGQQVDFTLDNQGSEAFFADRLAQLRTSAVTLLFDVPRAPGALAAYDRMVDTARALADALGGQLVDDNRRPLSDTGLAATRQAVVGVYAAMDRAGIAPGGPLARRLFAG